MRNEGRIRFAVRRAIPVLAFAAALFPRGARAEAAGRWMLDFDRREDTVLLTTKREHSTVEELVGMRIHGRG